MTKKDSRGIFTMEYQKHRYNSYISKSLCKLLADALPKDKPVYDFGCGTGEYLEYLQEQGFDVTGFDGTPELNDFSNIPIIEQDLTEPMNEPEMKGSVLCIEVAEHIEREKAGTLLDNLTKFVDKYLVLSWAIPGQGGVGHVNEQPNSFVISKMAKRRFELNKEMTEKWRAAAGKDLKWLGNTLMVFEKK